MELQLTVLHFLPPHEPVQFIFICIYWSLFWSLGRKFFLKKTSISIIQLQTTTSELTTPLYMNFIFVSLWVLYIFELSHFHGYMCSSPDNYTLRYLITGQEIHFVPLSPSNFWNSLVHKTCNQLMLHHFT